MFANRLQIVSSPAWQCAVTQIANAEIRQAGFDAKAGAERRPAHRDREPERAIEMNPRPLAPEAGDGHSRALAGVDFQGLTASTRS